MPLPVIATVFRVTLNWSLSEGVEPHNVMHFSSITDTEASLAAKIEGELASGMFHPIGNAHDLVSFDIIRLDGVSAAVNVVSTGGWSGGASGQEIANQAAIVSFHTPVRGPSGRGRVFLGPITEDINQGAGLITQIEADNLRTNWESFVTGMQAASAPLVVASYANTSFAEVTSITTSVHIRSQKRRLDQTL